MVPREGKGKEEDTFSTLPHPALIPPPQSGLRGLANRMEVGAGRTGSKRRHWPLFSLELAGGWGFPPRSILKSGISSEQGDRRISETTSRVTFSWKVCLE